MSDDHVEVPDIRARAAGAAMAGSRAGAGAGQLRGVLVNDPTTPPGFGGVYCRADDPKARGPPVGTLRRSKPYGLGMLDRDDSPWYPPMRRFRQKKRKDGESVLERVAGELAERVRDAGNGQGEVGNA